MFHPFPHPLSHWARGKGVRGNRIRPVHLQDDGAHRGTTCFCPTSSVSSGLLHCFSTMGEAGRGRASACAVTGVIPALLRRGQLGNCPPPLQERLVRQNNILPYNRRGFRRLAACLTPNRQVSGRLRGYLSPGGSFRMPGLYTACEDCQATCCAWSACCMREWISSGMPLASSRDNESAPCGHLSMHTPQPIHCS